MNLSPITKRRLKQFRANKRGYWSFWIFMVLLVLSLSASFIANDKPLMVNYKDKTYYPVLFSYPETTFGGDFETETDYRDEFVKELIEKDGKGWMLWPLIPYTYDTINYNLPCAAPSPSPQLTKSKWDNREIRNSIKYGFYLIGGAIHYTVIVIRVIFETAYSLIKSIGTGSLEVNIQIDRYGKFKPIFFSSCEKKIIDIYERGEEKKYNFDNYIGTDDQARDVTARVIYGFQLSVIFGLILTIVSSAVGIMAGAIQGYYGGLADLIMQRIMEIWQSMPSLYILIIFSAMFTPGFWTLFLILLLFSWMSLVDVVRAEFLRARNFDYVRAAHALGISDPVIMWRHVLPNAMVATITYMPFILTASITSLTALDFLGLGMPPGSPSLGELLKQGKDNLHAPWLVFCAFFSLATLLTLLTFIGEAVRDAFDPRKTAL